jgi:hypothetical protein
MVLDAQKGGVSTSFDMGLIRLLARATEVPKTLACLGPQVFGWRHSGKDMVGIPLRVLTSLCGSIGSPNVTFGSI